MIAELSQNRFMNSRNIKIYENKIQYRITKFGKSQEITIPFENLTGFKDSFIISAQPFLLAAVVSLFLAIICLFTNKGEEFDFSASAFYGMIFLLVTPIYFICRESLWKFRLDNLSYITLFKNIPNHKHVDKFIDIMFEQRKKYLKQTYLFVTPNMDYESQMKNLQWLRKGDVIDVTEFEKTKNELDMIFKSEKQSIGFHRN